MSNKEWFAQGEFIFIKNISNEVASWFGKTPPNLVTLIRFPAAVVLSYILFEEMYHTGFWFGTMLFLSDFVDGALARYQTKKLNLVKLTYKEEGKLATSQKLLLLGQSHFGAWLDAASDKFAVFAPLLVLGWGVIYTPILFLSILLSFFLFMVRPFKRWISKDSSRQKDDSNIFGKYKMWLQIICLISLNFSLWLAPEYASLLGNITLSVASFAAIGSLFGHLRKVEV